jgi:hypothetical protein
MFKKIPGSLDYLINLHGVIIDSYGSIVTLEEVSRGIIEIELFGKHVRMHKKELALLAWYEVGCINELRDHLDKIKFYSSEQKTLRVRCEFVMTFTEAIHYRDGFRYIPSFPRYAINLDGEVLDTLTNTIVTDRSISAHGYEVIYIYHPDKGGNRNVSIHRLLALAWLSNTDFINRPFINHIDGNKRNNRLENIEWCSHRENVHHALRIGLNGTTVKMKSRDRVTGEVTVYNSVSEMSAKLGMTNISAANFVNKLPGYLYKNRYEIKLFDDDRLWYYEGAEAHHDEPSKAIFTITVLDKKSGETRKFNNVRIFYKTYKLWTRGGTLDEAVALFKEKYPDSDVSYKRNSVVGPYRVYNLNTKKTTLCSSIQQAGECIGRSRTELQYDLSRGFKFIYSQEWIVVPIRDEMLCEDYKHKPKPFNGIGVVRESNGEEIVARSIKDAARISGLQFKTIANNLDTGKVVKGLKFRTLES